MSESGSRRGIFMMLTWHKSTGKMKKWRLFLWVAILGSDWVFVFVKPRDQWLIQKWFRSYCLWTFPVCFQLNVKHIMSLLVPGSVTLLSFPRNCSNVRGRGVKGVSVVRTRSHESSTTDTQSERNNGPSCITLLRYRLVVGRAAHVERGGEKWRYVWHDRHQRAGQWAAMLGCHGDDNIILVPHVKCIRVGVAEGGWHVQRSNPCHLSVFFHILIDRAQ